MARRCFLRGMSFGVTRVPETSPSSTASPRVKHSILTLIIATAYILPGLLSRSERHRTAAEDKHVPCWLNASAARIRWPFLRATENDGQCYANPCVDKMSQTSGGSDWQANAQISNRMHTLWDWPTLLHPTNTSKGAVTTWIPNPVENTSSAITGTHM